MCPSATRHGNPRISPTAYATASAWARYGFPGSPTFATRRGRAMLGGLDIGCRLLSPWVPGLAPGAELLYWRHRWFSAWVEQAAPTMAIEIGAGLSARGLVYARDHPASRWLDLDLPGMVKARRRRMAGLTWPVNYQLAAGDLLGDPIAHRLRPTDTGPAIALTEGVIEYLDAAAKQRAWANIVDALKALGGGRYLCEIYPRSRVADPHRPAGRLLARLAPTLSADIDTALAGLRAAGFRRARVLPDSGLPGAHQAPSPEHRLFCLLEAET